MLRRSFSILLLFVFAAISCLDLTACFIASEKFSYTFTGVFDTSVTVMAYSSNQKNFDEICSSAQESMNRYHRLFDIYNYYDGINNIAAVNANAGGSEIPVDAEIIELVEFGKDMYDISGGKLNIMMGAVLKIWHEYAEKGKAEPDKAELPDMQMLEDASEHCDIDSLIIDDDANILCILDPLACIDVGAIAKGFALQKTAESLKAKGYNNILINAGGNIASVGPKADGKAWNVAVQSPDEPDGYIGSRFLSDSALATSGDYQRFYTVDGKKYHHIIDPGTLFPAENMRSATIASLRADYADAYSTIVFLMDTDEALKFIENTEYTEALIMDPDGKILYSSGWENNG